MLGIVYDYDVHSLDDGVSPILAQHEVVILNSL